MNNIFISKGNIKVACPIFSMPAIKTCKACLQCHKFCYAMKAQRLYPNAKKARFNNYNASKQKDFAFNLWQTINKLILKSRAPITHIRIHESGDFYSTDYIKAWYEVIKRFSSIIFYTYTKRDDMFTKKLLKYKPSNLILYYSIDGIQEYNEVKFSELKRKYESMGYDGVSIITENNSFCPAQKSNKIKCMKNCFQCAMKGHVVIFKKH